MAAEWLKSRGYRILKRNYRFGKAEIDLLVRKGGALVAVEVKMRRAGHLQSLEAVIGRKKRDLLIQAADHYVRENDLDVDVRFDIIYILHYEDRYTLEHLAAAFSPY